MRKIAVFTSGGDAPGMNACIRAVVRTAVYHNIRVFGIERGLNGMIDDNFVEMQAHSVSNIIQRGGTVLKTSRSKSFFTKVGRRKAYENLVAYGIEGLVAIGGDGTYTAMDVFTKEYDIPVIGAPGTIDNDLYGTDNTIGFDTAVNTALDAIDKIRDTADSNDRIFFVEVMGRDAGFIAMDVGIGGGAEAILIPERHTQLDELVNTLRSGWGRHKGSQLIVVAEGEDAGGVFALAEKIKSEIPTFEYRITVLGHIQRGGKPSARDRVLASRLGSAAVDGLIHGEKGVSVGIVNNEIVYTPFNEAIKKNKPITEGLVQLAKILST